MRPDFIRECVDVAVSDAVALIVPRPSARRCDIIASISQGSPIAIPAGSMRIRINADKGAAYRINRTVVKSMTTGFCCAIRRNFRLAIVSLADPWRCI